MIILIVGAVICICVGACIAFILIQGWRKPTARPAQEVPAEVMAHAIPMEVEDVQLATVQMVQMPNGGQDVAAKKVSGISI